MWRKSSASTDASAVGVIFSGFFCSGEICFSRSSVMCVDSESHMNLLQCLFIPTEKDIRDGSCSPGALALKQECVLDLWAASCTLSLLVNTGAICLSTWWQCMRLFCPWKLSHVWRIFLVNLGALTTNKCESYSWSHVLCDIPQSISSSKMKTCIWKATANTSPLK